MSAAVQDQQVTWVRTGKGASVLGVGILTFRRVIEKTPIRCRRFPSGRVLYALEDVQALAQQFTGTTAPEVG